LLPSFSRDAAVAQRCSSDVVHSAFALANEDRGIDNSTVIRYKKQIAQEFCEQLTWGAPTNHDEAGLRRLSQQIKTQIIYPRKPGQD
jgi:hypothetical protein